MIAYLQGKKLNLNPTNSVGKGGEADIFDIGGDLVVKIFKQSNHPDLVGFPQDQVIAEARLKEHQQKLPAFPRNLPSRVVAPLHLATNKAGNKVLGYSMRFLKGYEVLLRYADRNFRQSGVNNDLVIKTFKDLRSSVCAIHKAGVVIGDFNDLNIMVANGEAYLIDADSFQFGPFLCAVYTEKFVDPLLCDSANTRPVLAKMYNPESDWYAFNVLLMQSLLYVGPYGGVYKPADKNKRVNHATRPLKRITIFDPEVKYPKPADHFSILPDELLQHFHQVFKEDKRAEFPEDVLNMRWTTCTNCGKIHARHACPACAQYAPAAVKETVRGKVTCMRVFQTPGVILHAALQNNTLNYLYYENGEFKRNDGLGNYKGQIKPTMRFRLRRKYTLIGDRDQFIRLAPGGKPEKVAVDSFGSLPLFDANEHSDYWVYDGRLMKSDLYGSKYIGDVLSKQTLFWIGSKFGFGFYRAGQLNIGFTFLDGVAGINDSVKLPPIQGQLVDSTCFFADNWAWFIVSTREKGQTVNRCVIIKSTGEIKATAEAREGDGSWLGSIRGKCAAGKFLLSATDDGIVRVEPNNGSISVVKEFPDTEPFVESGCHLFPGNNGLYITSRNTIKCLKIG